MCHVSQACSCIHAFNCRHAPFLISFQERAGVFTTVVGQDRMSQREMALQSGQGWGRQFFVTIHRTSLLQVSLLKPVAVHARQHEMTTLIFLC